MKSLEYYQSKENYEAFLKSGMFWEYFPELSGEWEKDKELWKIIIKEIHKKNGIITDVRMKKDPIVESVIQDLRERSEKGMKEYGVGLDRDDYSLLDWLKEAYTETLDKANYLKAAITAMEKEEQQDYEKHFIPPFG